MGNRIGDMVGKAMSKASKAMGKASSALAASSFVLAALGALIGIATACIEASGATSMGWFWATFALWAPWVASMSLAALAEALSWLFDWLA